MLFDEDGVRDAGREPSRTHQRERETRLLQIHEEEEEEAAATSRESLCVCVLHPLICVSQVNV